MSTEDIDPRMFEDYNPDRLTIFAGQITSVMTAPDYDRIEFESRASDGEAPWPASRKPPFVIERPATIGLPLTNDVIEMIHRMWPPGYPRRGAKNVRITVTIEPME